MALVAIGLIDMTMTFDFDYHFGAQGSIFQEKSLHAGRWIGRLIAFFSVDTTIAVFITIERLGHEPLNVLSNVLSLSV